MKRSKKVTIGILIFFVIVASVIGGRTAMGVYFKKKFGKRPPPGVVVEIVQVKEFSKTIESYCTALSSKTTSFKIKKSELLEPLKFKAAKKGDVIAKLQDKNIIYYPEDLIQAPPTHPYDFVSSFIHENNWANKNIGVEMDAYYYTAENHHRLTSTCPNVNFSDATLLVNWIRLIKSENEINYMREGAKLVEAGMMTAYENIKPGVKQSYVAGKIQNSLCLLYTSDAADE